MSRHLVFLFYSHIPPLETSEVLSKVKEPEQSKVSGESKKPKVGEGGRNFGCCIVEQRQRDEENCVTEKRD